MRQFVIATAILLGPTSLAAAGGAIPPHDLVTLADGLSDSTVYSVDQDHSGRMWFGTASGGANVYDGHGIRSLVNSSDPRSLSHSGAGQVLVRRSGAVMVGTWGGGLNRLRPSDDGFDRLNPDSAPLRIQTLFEDSEQRLWVGSSGDGLFLYEDGAGHQPVLQVDGQPLERIWALAETYDGRLWVAAQAGLFTVDSDRLRLELIEPLDDDPPRALASLRRTLWIARSNQVLALDLESMDLRPAGPHLPLINALHSDGDRRVLVGTLAGLVALDSDSGAVVPPVEAGPNRLFPDRNIRAIDLDETGMIWLATREAGVIRLSPRNSAFSGRSTRDQLETVDTLAELPSGRLLVGSRRGLWILDDTGDLSPVAGSEGFSVNQLVRDRDRVLVATRNGLLVFEEKTGALRKDSAFDPVDGLSITVVYVAPDESLWLGTWDEGLYHLPSDGSANRRYHTRGEPALPDNTVSAIEPDDEGGLWLGHWWQGLSRLDPEQDTLEHFVSSPEELGALPHGHVHGLHVQSNRVWVGTSFGFAGLEPASGEVTRIPITRESLPTSVQRLEGDALGRIWIASSRGVKRFDPRNGELLHFGSADGLITSEFYARSGTQDSTGRIHFGGVGGLVSFRPEDVRAKFEAPRVYVTEVLADSVAQSSRTGHLRIGPGIRELQLAYAAADFKDPQENRYQYRLIGDRDAWSAPSRDGRTTFAALPHGHYTFEVRAANSNGVWSLDSPARLEIEVVPYWWQTAVGRFGLALALAALVWLWFRAHTARIRADNRRLESEVNRQTEDLQRANERLATAAQTDFLTGLPNRRGFYSVTDARAPDLRGAIALADVDNFKQLNDRFGHELGDRVLRQIAGAIASVLRPEDLVARWGGEEFILLFSDVDLDEAVVIAERVRQAIADLAMHSQPDVGGVSITIGVAELTAHEDLDRCIARADGVLYEGKLAGKNQVVRVA